jgi:hypothetical protein
MKNFKSYFKDKLIIFIVFPVLATYNTFTMDDASIPWRIIAQVVLWGIPVGTLVYGLFFKKYK